MHFRGLLAAAAILGVLSIAVWFSNKAEKEKEGKPAPDAPPKIVEIPTDQIQRVAIAKDGAVTILERNADGKWALTAPKAFRADQDAASGLVNTFNSLASDRLVEEKGGNPADFGLVTPSLAVTITRKDNKATKLLLGDETPTGGGVFAKLDGDPRIFTLASFNRTSIDKSFGDLQDRRLLAFDGDKVTRIELSLKGQTVEFGKNAQSEWQIVKPKPMRADGASVDDVVRRLREAKMDAPVAGEDTAKQVQQAARDFAAAAAVATARVTDASGTHVLELRKAKDNTYYAKGSAVEGVHKVTADLGDGLSKSVDDFRQKKLFDFGWNDLTKVEVKDNGVSRVFAKDKDKWKEGAKELDSTSVQALVDKLRDFAATGFRDSGAGAPIFEASVSWSEGKRSEKVLLSKSGDTYYAVRDGEPAVYEIGKTAFEELQSAAKDVKAPAPPAKDEKKKK
ncbi:MAG: DUF4340 domain-containing protein [Bryobacteraceae bacterium]